MLSFNIMGIIILVHYMVTSILVYLWSKFLLVLESDFGQHPTLPAPTLLPSYKRLWPLNPPPNHHRKGFSPPPFLTLERIWPPTPPLRKGFLPPSSS